MPFDETGAGPALFLDSPPQSRAGATFMRAVPRGTPTIRDLADLALIESTATAKKAAKLRKKVLSGEMEKSPHLAKLLFAKGGWERIKKLAEISGSRDPTKLSAEKMRAYISELRRQRRESK